MGFKTTDERQPGRGIPLWREEASLQAEPKGIVEGVMHRLKKIPACGCTRGAGATKAHYDHFLLENGARLLKYHDTKRVAVTGGAGFLGSHLSERLLQMHCEVEVLCIDNFFTGTRRNINHLLSKPNFELLRHDITFPLFVEVDEIYNLACPASPVHYQHDLVQTTKVNIHGSINMLGLAKRCKARILPASTSEVYGDPAVRPQPETYLGSVNPVGLRACYDEGKRCAEALFFDYHRPQGVQIKAARIRQYPGATP